MFQSPSYAWLKHFCWGHGHLVTAEIIYYHPHDAMNQKMQNCDELTRHSLFFCKSVLFLNDLFSKWNLVGKWSASFVWKSVTEPSWQGEHWFCEEDHLIDLLMGISCSMSTSHRSPSERPTSFSIASSSNQLVRLQPLREQFEQPVLPKDICNDQDILPLAWPWLDYMKKFWA